MGKSYQKAGTESLNMGAFRVLMTEPEKQGPRKKEKVYSGSGCRVFVPGL